MNLRQARKMLEIGYQTGTSVILLGSPGIGKTAVIAQFAKERGIGFLCFEGSSLDPTDVRGVLIPHGEQSIFTRSPLLPRPEHGPAGILLIDELSSATESVQVSLHPLFLHRRLGEHHLPEGWVPMATGNFSSDGAGASGLLTALMDRLVVCHVQADPEVWLRDYAIPNNIHPMIIGFIRFRPQLLDTFQSRKRKAEVKSFATPRSYEHLSRMLQAIETTTEESTLEFLKEVATGILGEGVATEFITYYRLYSELPDVREILYGRFWWPKEFSQITAVISALPAAIRSCQDIDIQQAMTNVLEYTLCDQMPAEHRFILVQDLIRLFPREVASAGNFRRVAEVFGDAIFRMENV